MKSGASFATDDAATGGVTSAVRRHPQNGERDKILAMGSPLDLCVTGACRVNLASYFEARDADFLAEGAELPHLPGSVMRRFRGTSKAGGTTQSFSLTVTP